MMIRKSFLGLTGYSQNAVCTAIAIFIVCVGIRVTRSTDTDLKVANVQLTTSSSANKLERLAQQLEIQAEVIKRKETAYQELQTTYNEYVSQRKDGTELKQKIQEVESLPKVENIQEIQTEIQETEQELLDVTEE